MFLKLSFIRCKSVFASVEPSVCIMYIYVNASICEFFNRYHWYDMKCGSYSSLTDIIDKAWNVVILVL